jgi:predicted deacylase
MDTWVRTLSVAIASIVAGFLLSKLLGDEVAESGAAAGVSAQAEVAYADLVSEIATAPVQHVQTVAVAVALEPRPTPIVLPSASYRYVPVPVVEMLPVAPEVTATESVDDDPAITDVVDIEEGPPELEYVAMLNEADADVEDGFDELAPGTLTRMTWHAGESLYGSAIPTPVLVAEGMAPGQTLCLSAAVHGDELNGIEIVRRVMYSLNPEKLTGRVIGVPIVNLQGFERHSRYLPDRRDLNRFFPGNPRGSSASRIAYSFFRQIVKHCDALVDLHTGSFHRTNLPQLRANLLDESVLEMTEGFGGLVILHSTGGMGTLRAAAVRAGVPAVTLEAGEPLRVDDKAVDHSVKALYSLLDDMGMYKRRSFWGTPEPTYYGSMWVRADKGGMLLGDVKLGKRVKQGDVLGTVTDPITNVKQEILAPQPGRVIGMALNQFVMPGYAAFHLGVEAPDGGALPESPSAEEIDHSVALADGVLDERYDSDE